MSHYKKDGVNVCSIEVSTDFCQANYVSIQKEHDSVIKFDSLFDISQAKHLETMKYEVNKAFFLQQRRADMTAWAKLTEY